MADKTAISLGASTLGVLAAVAYATQHPLQQPLLRDIVSPFDSLAFAVLSSELVGILVIFCLVLFKGSRHEVLRLLAEPLIFFRLFLIAALNSLSLLLYFVAIRTYDVVPVSTILNLFPFYALIVSAIVWKTTPRLSSTLIFGAVAASIIVIGASDPNQTPASSIARFLFVSLVPVIFSVVQTAKTKWFEGYGAITYVSVVTVFDAVIFVPAALIVLGCSDSFAISQVLERPLSLSVFCVGAVLSGFIAQYLLQRALRVNASSIDYATAPFFLIPMLSGLIGVLLRFFNIGDSQGFTQENVFSYAIFALGFLLFYFWDSIHSRLTR